MRSKLAVGGARTILGVAVVAGMLFGGVAAAAEDHDVTVAIHVSTQSFDLSQPASAQKFYARLEHAAWVVCTHGNRVDLAPVDDPNACYEKALGDAVRATRNSMVTQIYLAGHTLQQAVAYGIDIPAQVAAK
jgi:UrcA family protein